MNKFFLIIIIIAIILLLLGIFFQIVHYQYGKEIVHFGIGLCLAVIIVFFIKLTKR